MTEKFTAKKNNDEWALAKLAVRCPGPLEARRLLMLTRKQFGQLLEISEGDVIRLECGDRALTVNQKAFIVSALRLAREKGIIPEGQGGLGPNEGR